MDLYYKSNINNLDFNFKNISCKFYLKKNGNILYFPHEIIIYICIFNKKSLYNISYTPFYLYNNDYIIKSLLIMAYIQKKSDLKYIYYKKKSYLLNSIPNNSVEKLLNILYIKDQLLLLKKKNFDIKKSLMFEFLFLRLSYCSTISDRDIMVELFYTKYIIDEKYLIKHNLKNEYNKDISIDFANYHQLYKFLEKIGYVKEFYNNYYKYIKKNYIDFYNNYISKNSVRLEKFKLKIKKNIKSFNNINLDNYIYEQNIKLKDKEYIKYKFIELKKKYNI